MQPKTFSYESMGTRWEISIWDDIDDARLASLETELYKRSTVFDTTYSRFIKSSLVWRIAQGAGVYEVPKDFTQMLQLYFDLYEATDKKLNPLIGFTISDLGYDAEYSFIEQKTIRTTPDLYETVRIIDATHIETKEAVLFDFGALGKGYFVDRIADFLRAEGIERFLVNGSGDIFYQGKEPIRAGLEDPNDASRVLGVIELGTGAFCASGSNRRVWGNHSHVIDPTTNASVSFITATWVQAKTSVLADALASCLFFVPPEKLNHYGFDYWIVNNENKLKSSMPLLAS